MSAPPVALVGLGVGTLVVVVASVALGPEDVADYPVLGGSADHLLKNLAICGLASVLSGLGAFALDVPVDYSLWVALLVAALGLTAWEVYRDEGSR